MPFQHPLRLCCIFLLALVGWSLSGTARANNSYFLPGDAFFPTSFTEAELQKLQEQDRKTRVFKYDEMGAWEPAFCGYAGFAATKIPDIDERFLDNLAKTYKKLRADESREFVEIIRDGKTTLVEKNGMRVLFYPINFDIERFHFGLQYNEDWADELTKFGHNERFSTRLCSFVDRKEAIESAWRCSKIVPGMKAEFPKFKPNPSQQIEEPMTITEPVKAIVLRGGKACTTYFERNPNESIQIFVVDSFGIDDLQWDKWTWIKQEAERANRSLHLEPSKPQ